MGEEELALVTRMNSLWKLKKLLVLKEVLSFHKLLILVAKADSVLDHPAKT